LFRPGSQRAEFCRKGQAMMYDFLEKQKLPFRRCGKLIVAVEESEIKQLKLLFERAQVIVFKK
jgi:L-2-hydroxyglutarate oxidase LhgO